MHNGVNDPIPRGDHSPEALDDLLSNIHTQGIDVLEGQPKPSHSALEQKLAKEVETSNEVELNLTPGALEETNDLVRIYLRRMGMVPLLTREGEVKIAKRIERGQGRALKALSRSPMVIRQIIAIGGDLRRGVRSLKEVVVFGEEEITEEILQNRVCLAYLKFRWQFLCLRRADQQVLPQYSCSPDQRLIFPPACDRPVQQLESGSGFSRGRLGHCRDRRLNGEVRGKPGEVGRNDYSELGARTGVA